MPAEFSIEMAAKRIVDERTREYFEEVKGCYNAGYYRSCIVMLWSVVICDLLYKLDLLANLHGDLTAKSILSEIEGDRQANPNSPKWEEKLLELINNRTEMLDPASFLSLQTLQKYRHLSAHPVLAENDILFSPTQEIARAHLRSALECLLTRPAMMSRKIFDAFMEDIEANSVVLTDDDSVSKYISTKYGPHLTEIVQNDLFKRLWKLVFRADDQRSEKNRGVNFRALAAVYERSPTPFDVLIRNDHAYYGDCRFNGNLGLALTGFLRRYPQVYKLLNAATQQNVRNFVSQDHDRLVTAWYLADNPTQHAFNIFSEWPADQEIKPSTFALVIKQLRIEGDLLPAKQFAIEQYACSKSFSVADHLFDAVLRPLLPDFNLDDLQLLMEKCESNRQTHKRGTEDHQEIKSRIDQLSSDKFDYTRFPKMYRSMQAKEESSTELF